MALLLPGFGYTLDMPLFYYAENILLERGWDVLRVEYAYNRLPGTDLVTDQERMARLCTDASAAFHAGLGAGGYDELALVGKSLGTLAMVHLLENPGGLPAPPTRTVWLTPLLTYQKLLTQMRRSAFLSLVVIGTADPYYDAVLMEELRAGGHETVVISGADHGMDIPGDPLASVRGLQRIVSSLSAFFPSTS